MLSRGVLDIPILPSWSKPGSEGDELELRDMDGRARLLHDLLRRLGTAHVHRAYRIRQK